MTDENTNYTTAVPAVTFSKTGLLVPDEVDILNGRLTDFSTALGSSMGTSLTSPQGQLAMSDSAIIADKNAQLLAIANQVNADYSSGRFQDAIGRFYFLDRIGATGTTVTGTCSGLVDTLIPAGSLAQDEAGYLYASLSDATIGAAAVVGGAGEDIGKTMQSKVNSVMRSKLHTICEENGHNPEVAEAFMFLESELKMGDKVIDSKETLLSLNGREAARVYDGKPLLAAGLVETVEELVKQEKLPGPVMRVEPTGFEQLAFWITTLSPLLLMAPLAAMAVVAFARVYLGAHAPLDVAGGVGLGLLVGGVANLVAGIEVDDGRPAALETRDGPKHGGRQP